MDDLAAFYAARLGEADAVARAAGGTGPEGQWARNEDEVGTGYGHLRDGDGDVVVYDEGAPGDVEFDHIARYDPACVLDDIAADRAILDLYQEQRGWDLPEGVHDGRGDDERMRDEAVMEMLEQVVKIRAARFAGHPDYRAEEWAP